MGLDMYLEARRRIPYHDSRRHTLGSEFGVQKNWEATSVTFEVGYWRKANHIHKWFVKNIQGGKDDCADYYVNKVDLESLRDLCLKVKADPDKAQELLPTQGQKTLQALSLQHQQLAAALQHREGMLTIATTISRIALFLCVSHYLSSSPTNSALTMTQVEGLPQAQKADLDTSADLILSKSQEITRAAETCLSRYPSELDQHECLLKHGLTPVVSYDLLGEAKKACSLLQRAYHPDSCQHKTELPKCQNVFQLVKKACPSLRDFTSLIERVSQDPAGPKQCAVVTHTENQLTL